MDSVGVTQFRSDLKDWLRRAQSGKTVTITDRGAPVARLVPPEGEELLDLLIREGVARPPLRPKRAGLPPLVRAKGTVSDLIERR